MSLHIATDNGTKPAKTVLMPGDPLRAKFIAENFLEDAKLYSQIRNMYGYTGTYKGVPVSVQGSGMGMPSMGIYSWELYTTHGVENIIRIGTSGAFSENLKLGDIILSIAASTDSNYQHAYDIPGIYAPSASFELIEKIQAASAETGITFTAGNTVSCDVFFEVRENWWKAWADMDVLAVEMEAAALYMNAARLGKNAVAITTVSDEFVTGNKASVEDREKNFTNMMELALNAAIK